MATPDREFESIIQANAERYGVAYTNMSAHAVRKQVAKTEGV
ncbi:hypothetical protein [Burkholderia sp. Bp8998]|nr:hypothetical protein [Burkholderia sp. Bp8998]